MQFFETIQDELVTIITNGLIAKGYEISNKEYFVRKLDNLINNDNDLFQNTAVAASKGGVFITYQGAVPELKGKHIYTDKHEFLIIAFIKIGTNGKTTDLYNMIEDINSIVYKHIFTNNKSMIMKERRINPIPNDNAKNRAIYYGYIATTIENVYLPI